MRWRLYEWLGNPHALALASAEERMSPETNLPPVEPSGWRTKQLPYRVADLVGSVDFLRSYGVPHDRQVVWDLVTKNVAAGQPVMFTAHQHGVCAVIGVVAA